MQKIFEITNRYIILATPLVLFSMISSIYLVASLSGGKILSILFAIILFTLMTSAFIAGWLKMVRGAVETPDNDEPYLLIKDFVPGVGEYFLSATGAVFLMFFLFGLLYTFAYLNTIVFLYFYQF